MLIDSCYLWTEIMLIVLTQLTSETIQYTIISTTEFQIDVCDSPTKIFYEFHYFSRYKGLTLGKLAFKLKI